jgi:hypothetical protein
LVQVRDRVQQVRLVLLNQISRIPRLGHRHGSFVLPWDIRVTVRTAAIVA